MILVARSTRPRLPPASKMERSLYGPAILSAPLETEFFNRIGRMLTDKNVSQLPTEMEWTPPSLRG